MFLRMIKMIIAPLLFSTLVVGIAGTGDLRAMGRIGLKAIIWFELATTVALVIGLVMMNVFRPERAWRCRSAPTPASSPRWRRAQQSGWDILLHLLPTSVVDAMARGDILQIVVFATFFGVALAAIGDEGQAARRAARQPRAGDVPVHGLRDAVRAGRRDGGHRGDRRRQGPRASSSRSASSCCDVRVAGDLRAAGGRRRGVLIRVPFLAFLRAIREPFLIAFTTASSEAALPKSLEVMERFGVPKRIVSFVLPTGYSMNLDGSTLYLSAASLFVAQLAGVELPSASSSR